VNLDETLNVAELAELYAVHRHTVEEWVKDGLPAARNPQGTKVLAQLRASVQWIRKRDAERADAALRKARDEGDQDSSKARKLAAEARLKELSVAEKEKRLVSAEEVEASWSDMMTAIRESVMAVSGALVQSNFIRPEDEGKVEALIADALTNAKLPDVGEEQ
jgi:phage terminase Nu1 subunit (DNA packaging protein)